MEAKKKKIGRPSKFSKELVAKIADLLVSGKGLAEIGRMDEFPSAVTIYSWLNRAEAQPENQELNAFLNTYLRARYAQADMIFDECLTIADNEPDIQRATLMINTRMRMAGKLKPKKYGDKVAVAVDNSPLTITHVLQQISGTTRDLPANSKTMIDCDFLAGAEEAEES